MMTDVPGGAFVELDDEPGQDSSVRADPPVNLTMRGQINSMQIRPLSSPVQIGRKSAG